jgi:TM2 domain-containing membrane protein YozV
MTKKIKALIVAGIGSLLFLFSLPFILIFLIMFAWLIVPLILAFCVYLVSYAMYNVTIDTIEDDNDTKR